MGWSLSTVMDQAYAKVTLSQGFQNISVHIFSTSMSIEEYQIIFCHFVKLEKSKATCSFAVSEAPRLPYLTALYQD